MNEKERKTAMETSDELMISYPKYNHEKILEMQNKDLISLTLWASRRLSHQQYKSFVYDELEHITGVKHERV